MCRTLLVSGKVQGVGYRDFARRAAREIAIEGYARNLPDGRVEVLACGADAALAAFTARLREGPRWSRVDALEQLETDCRSPRGFSIE